MSDENKQTRVGHCKADETDVYAGRGRGGKHMNNTPVGERGWLGNPYTAEEYGREEAIDRFTADFADRIHGDTEFRAAVRRLAGKTLGCWCQFLNEDRPRCHAEVIARQADRMAQSKGGSDE